MPKTKRDHETEVMRLKSALGKLEQEVAGLNNEHNRRVHAIERVNSALEEAIAFTGRWAELRKLDPQSFQAAFEQRVRDAARLNKYFNDCKREFSAILNGWPVPEAAERPVFDEGTGSDAGEGREQGDTSEEHQDDSG